MKPYPYDKQAKQQLPMPEGLTIVEQATYQAISFLAARYTLGKISSEQAVKEYKSIIHQYEQLSADERLIHHYAQLTKDIEIVSLRFKKEQTLEAANLMYDILYGFTRLTEKDRANYLQGGEN